MNVSLRGSSPAALTAGILLMSRARGFGQRLSVEVVGDPADITPVQGPALVHSPVLASCGVGRRLGSGSLVIVPGPPSAPLATSLSKDGTGPWFEVDREGVGQHPATRAFVALCRDPRPAARDLGRRLRQLLHLLGCPPEPALLDLLFQPEAPGLTRVGVALRAGRTIMRDAPTSLTRFMSGGLADLPDPLPDDLDWTGLDARRASGEATALLDRLSVPARFAVEEWLADLAELEDGPVRYGDLAAGLAAAASHLIALPVPGMLPPLQPSVDAVAVGLGAALGAADPPHDAARPMLDTFRFLGGRFVEEARFAVQVHDAPAPEDRLERWRWFCTGTRNAADTADALWRRVVDFDS